jgi:hypothetical protein
MIERERESVCVCVYTRSGACMFVPTVMISFLSFSFSKCDSVIQCLCCHSQDSVDGSECFLEA